MMLLVCFLLANSMNAAREEGRTLGKTGKSQAFSQIEHFPSKELLPSEQRGESFDAERARESVEKREIPRTAPLDYLQSAVVQQNEVALSNTEYFLERSENISQNPQIENLEVEEALEYHIETCQQTDAPYPISVIRDLEVKVTFDPGESKEVKVCCRHEYKRNFQHKKDADKQVKELKHSLAHWKSRDEHVFCCFGTKLARILQENARGQLGLNWDSPKHANCRGLMIDEISHLDFSKMDFSELYSDYEKKLPGNFQSKLELLENRLKEKLREDDGNKA